MLNLQKEFMDFHDNIKLDGANKNLREKRDILLKKLKEKISDDAATYTTLNQGSYAMGTGILPEGNDYDIDVGLRFDIDKADYDDPIVPKKWVRDALEGHTNSVEIRRSCVTVTYQSEDEPLYHIDFAVYANSNPDGKMYIAKGKEFSSEENRMWDISDPQGLIDTISNKFDSDDAKQFRRVIRYMKKWKTHSFSSDGNGAPTGIGMTVLAYNNFNINKTHDWSTGKDVYDDFSALYSLVLAIKNQFTYCWNTEDECYYHKISIDLPVEPKNNLFSKMTEKQMETFYQKTSTMLEKLDEVKDKTKKSEACEILVKLFGKDFPVTVEKSMVGTSESA